MKCNCSRIQIILLCVILMSASEVFAGGCATSQMQVSCTVTRGKNSFDVQTNQSSISVRQTFSSATNNISVGGFNVSCAEGTYAEVIYDTTLNKDSSCPIPHEEHGKLQPDLYADMACTEVWGKGERLKIEGKDSGKMSFYCKHKEDNMTIKDDKCHVIMSLTVNY